MGELVQTTSGKWITHPPSRCPNGHPLGANQVLTPNMVISGKALQRFLGGAPVQVLGGDVPKSSVPEVDWQAVADARHARSEVFKRLPATLQKVNTKLMLAVERESGEAEARAAKALGREPWVVNLASAKLWKSTLSAERDRRAGPDASPQARGRITRELRAEIKAALDGDG